MDMHVHVCTSVCVCVCVMKATLIFHKTPLSRDGRWFDHHEEFPINLLHEFSERSGHQATRVLVAVLEYGPDFSGPGKDIFRYDRATGEPSQAHESNFLHPVLYYYERLPSGKHRVSTNTDPKEWCRWCKKCEW